MGNQINLRGGLPRVKRRIRGYNPKRQIVPRNDWDTQWGRTYAAKASYGGNPEHKRYPGNYNLTPPSNPRPGKTLCDGDDRRVILKEEAEALLRQGFARGLVSVQVRGGWPQNVWAVSESGDVFEAQLENQGPGTYHGCSMPEDDDFRAAVIEEWHRRGQ